MKDLQQALQSQLDINDYLQLLQDIQRLYIYDLSQTISNFDSSSYLAFNSQISQVGESLKKLKSFIGNDIDFASKQHEILSLSKNVQKTIHHLNRELAVKKENLKKLKMMKQSLFINKN